MGVVSTHTGRWLCELPGFMGDLAAGKSFWPDISGNKSFKVSIWGNVGRESIESFRPVPLHDDALLVCAEFASLISGLPANNHAMRGHLHKIGPCFFCIACHYRVHSYASGIARRNFPAIFVFFRTIFANLHACEVRQPVLRDAFYFSWLLAKL